MVIVPDEPAVFTRKHIAAVICLIVCRTTSIIIRVVKCFSLKMRKGELKIIRAKISPHLQICAVFVVGDKLIVGVKFQIFGRDR